MASTPAISSRIARPIPLMIDLKSLVMPGETSLVVRPRLGSSEKAILVWAEMAAGAVILQVSAAAARREPRAIRAPKQVRTISGSETLRMQNLLYTKNREF